jgi:hypothetical protein
MSFEISEMQGLAHGFIDASLAIVLVARAVGGRRIWISMTCKGTTDTIFSQFKSSLYCKSC